MEVHGPKDSQQRHQHAATIHSTHTTLTSELDGQLRGAETALTHRIEAFEGRVPTLENRVFQVEQHIPELRTALAELRVARARTDQLGTPTSVYDFAPLEARMAE
eukprot:3756151-Pyramimonas_sp.AAC.2